MFLTLTASPKGVRHSNTSLHVGKPHQNSAASLKPRSGLRTGRPLMSLEGAGVQSLLESEAAQPSIELELEVEGRQCDCADLLGHIVGR